MFWRYEVTGVDTITLHFGDAIDIALVDRIQRAARTLADKLEGRLIDIVPSYTTLLLRYDLLSDDLASLVAGVSDALSALPETGAEKGSRQVIEIPVYYAPSVGPDLESIATHSGLTPEQVIQRHCSGVYNVFAIGFAPGFAYLGEVPPELATPRLATPRPKVPAGTLGIADTQTALYPLESPGGWNLIGRTPLSLFDPGRERPALLEAGQQVRFRAISRDEYLELGGRLDDLPWASELPDEPDTGDQK
ncbi:5-oxoprolinase subunit PxpB [Marinobacter pelagius]|uniref:5-oxoprolinase subunit PxpB n=1 Tax=Marinobacter sp. C7 TaxID=2951363 RepID=UPI001EEFB525|nr:5-oxoprolinase subunit PxpB [Marinobacter sp. C7]MCG7199435.1 5-oxoprolinase subunit PxpB [Marinobacter sp. C7]